MMVLTKTLVKQGFRTLGRIDRKYNINKIFVEKYVPPGYRQTVRRIFDITGALGGGYYIYSALDTFLNQNAVFSPKPKLPKTYSQYKTRGGFSRRSNFGYQRKNANNSRCRCTRPC